jgi:hypothetical protein
MKRIVLATLLSSAAPSFADETVATPSVDMGAWESQVLGSIFGLYCGYYPDRLTIIGRTAGLTSYKQCAKLYSAIAPACVAQAKKTATWRVTTPEEGTLLGSQIGGCIDQKFAAAKKR